MKLTILYRWVDGPSGGGNQFLKALKAELLHTSHYTEKMPEADAVLANVNPGSLMHLAKRLPRLSTARRPLVIFRVDGPISLVRGRDAYLDRLIARLITLYGDGIIFQSQWSHARNEEQFGLSAPYTTVIHNAPDPNIFFSTSPPPVTPGSKIKLIATSWSANVRKGFAVYQYLDTHLDWSRYEMTFIGNAPVTFKNIRHLAPLASTKLAQELRQHHLFITASEHDPCSNSLIEALACGLPAVVRSSGGHPELIGQAGVTFATEHDVLPAIEAAARRLPALRAKLPQYSITTAAKQYLAFAQLILADVVAKRYQPKQRSLPTYLKNHAIVAEYWGRAFLKTLRG